MRRIALAIILGLVVQAAGAASPSLNFLNRIEGQVFDEKGQPLGDMYVELQNDVGSSLRTVRSTSLGRFTFPGLSNGVFRVRVLPSGKNYLEQIQDVQFTPSLTGRSDDITYLEFHLRVDRRRAEREPTGSPDAIFVQEVPDEARRLYRSALDEFDKDTSRGIAGLEKAVAAFPTYFDALSRLGKEYALRKQFDKAYPLLLRAIDVNSRSFTSYYFLGWSFYQLNEIPAAIKAAEACTVIMPSMAEGHVLLGTVLRLNKEYTRAEKELRRAMALDKKNAQAHWQLALLLNRLNRNNEAADELEAFLKLNPPDDADKKAAQDLVARLRAAKKD